MECPFRELHEFYKIVYDRAEARAKAEAEREEEERKQKEKEEAEERRRKGLAPQIYRAPPSSDVSKEKKPNAPVLSPYADDFEDILEEIAEGGVM